MIAPTARRMQLDFCAAVLASVMYRSSCRAIVVNSPMILSLFHVSGNLAEPFKSRFGAAPGESRATRTKQIVSHGGARVIADHEW